MRPLGVFGRSAAMAIASSAIAAAPARADDRPPALPALARWTPSDGPAFRLRSDARIVVRHADRAFLRGEGGKLAEDLGQLLHRPVEVTARHGASARTGDIVMARHREPALAHEGYRLSVGRAFTITANATAGAFYGGRTLLQLVRAGTPIPRGCGRDAPVYSERGLMIDVGRRYYRPAWLAARIRQLGDLKLNELHLHLSDDQGFRIRSTTHPEAVTEPALNHADIASLVRVAARNHVTLIPEIDAPGHLTAALRGHPELQLTSIAGERKRDKLDVTNPAARRFYADLVGEIAPLFPARPGTSVPTSISGSRRPPRNLPSIHNCRPTPRPGTAAPPTARTPCSTSSTVSAIKSDGWACVCVSGPMAWAAAAPSA
jgi:hexosaminidase